MATVEQRLKRIENTILQEANSKAEEIIFKAMSTKNESLEEAEIAILQRLYGELNEEISSVRNKTAQYISRCEMKNKKKLLAKRDELFKRIFDNVFSMLIEFTKEDQYKQAFINKIRNLNCTLDLDFLEFQIKKDDQVLKLGISDEFQGKATIVETEDILIGGFKIINKKTGICMDESIDTYLHDQRGWVYTNSKLTID